MVNLFVSFWHINLLRMQQLGRSNYVIISQDDSVFVFIIV